MSYQPTISPQLRRRPDRMASYYNDAQKMPVATGSPSLTDDPSMTRNIQGAKRDKSLLTRQYTQLKRRGDYAGAMTVAKQADAMGLPVGRPANDDETQGAGVARYYDDLRRTGGTPRPGGLAGFDFRQRGYSAMLGENESSNEAMTDPNEKNEGYERPAATTAISPLLRKQDKTAGWRQAWAAADTQEDKDAIVERAASYGVPLSKAGKESLERRRPLLPEAKLPLLPEAKLSGVRPGPSPETQEPDLSTLEGRITNMKRSIGRGDYDQFTKPDVEWQTKLDRRTSDFMDAQRRKEMADRSAATERGLEAEYQRATMSERVPETMDPTLNRPKERRRSALMTPEQEKNTGFDRLNSSLGRNGNMQRLY